MTHTSKVVSSIERFVCFWALEDSKGGFRGVWDLVQSIARRSSALETFRNFDRHICGLRERMMLCEKNCPFRSLSRISSFNARLLAVMQGNDLDANSRDDISS